MISNVGLQSTCTSILFVLATRSEEEEACDDDEDLLLHLLKLFCKERVKPSGLPCFLLPSVVLGHWFPRTLVPARTLVPIRTLVPGRTLVPARTLVPLKN